MASDIEMDDIGQPRQQHEVVSITEDALRHDESVPLWVWGSAILLLALSMCLTVFPRLLLFMSEAANEARPALTPLETFLALHFGIWLAAIAAALVLNVPSATPAASPRGSAYSHPLLGSLTVASLISSFISYNTTDVGSLASVVFVISGVIGLWGLWTAMFAGSQSISKKTGADKHSSSFLFGNKNAASLQKKEWRKTKARRP